MKEAIECVGMRFTIKRRWTNVLQAIVVLATPHPSLSKHAEYQSSQNTLNTREWFSLLQYARLEKNLLFVGEPDNEQREQGKDFCFKAPTSERRLLC